MDPVLVTFLATGVIVFIGFFGDVLFRKYRIPDILILIFLGLLLGPIFGIFSGNLITNTISSIFIALALVMILFDCGLNLNFKKVIKESPKALSLALLGVLFSIFFVSIFAKYLLHWNWLYSILLGSIIAGSSSSIIIPLVSRLKLPQRIRTMLELESAFTDVFVVIIGITVLQLIINTSYDVIYVAAKEITAAFSVGAMFGILFGLVWIKLLRKIQKHRYQEILTLSFLLLIYAITEFLGGSGAMSALFFGLVLGNGFNIGRIFEMSGAISADTIMKKFHSELTFFVRTFLFVYMGLIISFSSLEFILYAVIISFILFAARYLAVRILSVGDNVLKLHGNVVSGLLARGLSAAVVSQMVANSGIENASAFPEITVFVIIITVTISALASIFR